MTSKTDSWTSEFFIEAVQTRVRHRRAHAGHLEWIGERGESSSYLVAIDLQPSEGCKTYLNGEVLAEGPIFSGAVLIASPNGHWIRDYLGSFDLAEFEIPDACLAHFAEENGWPSGIGFRDRCEAADLVLAGLASALLLSLENPDQVNEPFVEKVMQALLAHLCQVYGGLHFPTSNKGILTPGQQRTAVDYLESHFNDGFSIEELAERCELSRSYFMKAFKVTYGRTPHRWLTEYRLNQAQQLLQSEDLAIAEVAVTCGFSDQSHMTRVFTELLGETPAQIRRVFSRKSIR